MRAFIGIDFSKELKQKITGLQAELRKHAVSGRWKYVDNFHLTLKFLDEIDLKKASQIGKELEEICSRTERFSLRVSEMGNFPGRDSIRVLWLGLKGDIDRLNNLQNKIDSSMQNLGFESEKRGFKPHVTIGQDLIFDIGFDELKGLVDFKGYPEIAADRVYLFKSEQIGKKRVYTPINQYALQGKGEGSIFS